MAQISLALPLTESSFLVNSYPLSGENPALIKVYRGHEGRSSSISLDIIASLEKARNAKIHNLDRSIKRQHQVIRLYICLIHQSKCGKEGRKGRNLDEQHHFHVLSKELAKCY